MDARAIVATIEETGCCVVPEFLPSQSLERLRDRLDELNRRERASGDAVLDAGSINIRVRTIVNKGEIFELVVQDPFVAEVMSTMLGERFIVSTFDSYTTNPGGDPERELHKQSPLRIQSDTGYIHYPHPPYHLAASAFWMLDDFTEENGATRYVPGSHRRTDRVDRAESYPERAITGPAGSLGFIHGELCITLARTRPPIARRGLFAYYVRSFIRPIDNHAVTVSESVWKRATPTLRRLLGGETFY